MLNIPNAPDVGYYLSRHPETIAKLWSLETSGQGIKVMEELNHISSGLRFQANATQSGASAAARRERQPNSGPPAPIRPVGGSSHSAGPNIADPNLDYQSYKRLMAEQARSKGRQW
jgi:hypothetical protein